MINSAVMRQATARSSFPHRFCQSALFLCLLPLLVHHSQGSMVDSSTCNQDCSGRTMNQICASNGVTYDNRCEMQLAACQQNIELTIRDSGPCNSPTEPAIPTKGETCPQHSARIKRLSSNNDWLAMCSQAKLQEKSNNGTITMQDLISCYRPDCNSNSYAPKQCHAIGRRISQVEYCWCSGPTGLSIPDTLTSDMQPNVCFLRQSCQYKGTQYADGEVFQPDHQCGICECLDGNVTCFEEFVTNVDGQLNTTQLNQLSHLLKQFFYFEDNHKDSILHDIRKISRMISIIDNETQMDVLNQWFQYYDSDGNGCIELNHTEEVSFHDHLHQFTSCNHFLDHVSEVFDADSSGSITLSEWLDFYVRHTPVSAGTEPPVIGRRSVWSAQRRWGRSVESRRKFYYVLSS